MFHTLHCIRFKVKSPDPNIASIFSNTKVFEGFTRNLIFFRLCLPDILQFRTTFWKQKYFIHFTEHPWTAIGPSHILHKHIHRQTNKQTHHTHKQKHTSHTQTHKETNKHTHITHTNKNTHITHTKKQTYAHHTHKETNIRTSHTQRNKQTYAHHTHKETNKHTHITHTHKQTNKQTTTSTTSERHSKTCP